MKLSDAEIPEYLKIATFTIAKGAVAQLELRPSLPPPQTELCHAYSLGVPRLVNLLRIDARICSSVTCRSKSRAITRSPNLSLEASHLGLYNKAAAVITAPFLPDGAA